MGLLSIKGKWKILIVTTYFTNRKLTITVSEPFEMESEFFLMDKIGDYFFVKYLSCTFKLIRILQIMNHC